MIPWMEILAGGMILLLPGAAFLAWQPSEDTDPVCRMMDAVGLSIALTALIAMVLWSLNLFPGAWGALIGYALALVFWIVALLLREKAFSWRVFWQDGVKVLAGLAFFTGLLIFRLEQAKPLVLPAWVDSVHHTFFVRMILEQGGVPRTLSPYLDAPFHYYFPFHLITALFAWITGMHPADAVLVLGQVISALLALAIYRLGRALRIPPLAAGMAALLCGFVTQMPAYYLTWGRTTLLMGLLVQALAMSAVLDYRRFPSRFNGWKAALLVSGLALTHYLSLWVFGLWVLVLFLGDVLGKPIRQSVETGALQPSQTDLSRWTWLGWIILGGVGAFPYLIPAFLFNLNHVQISAPAFTWNQQDWKYVWQYLGPQYNLWVMGMAGFAGLLALRHPLLRRFALWGFLVFFLGLPIAPRFGPFRGDLYLIQVFFPAVLLLGALLSDAIQAWGRKTVPWIQPILWALVMILFFLWGIRETRSILNQGTVFVTSADRKALEWVEKNTPPQARFYINAALWSWNIYRGVDGGYWLLPFTGRFSLVPPVPYVWTDPVTQERFNRWAKTAETLKGCSPPFWDLVREAGLTHVYLREGVGSLQPQDLKDCPRLKVIYQQEGVYLYEIIPLR
ncbi:hypothetical protein [Anaerolinea thermophila]|uniref:hypothetical protein n=2 Tax=Anaerolinea TaxID=233189 RepID=UPI0026EC5015|nr:hypothetical protein [Anaerolinea thermophila]